MVRPNFGSSVVLLARLAVDREHQRRHVGGSLLRDAMFSVLHASDAIGIRALVCMRPTATLAHGMSSPDSSQRQPTRLHLILLLKDLRHILGSGNE